MIKSATQRCYAFASTFQELALKVYGIGKGDKFLGSLVLDEELQEREGREVLLYMELEADEEHGGSINVFRADTPVLYDDGFWMTQTPTIRAIRTASVFEITEERAKEMLKSADLYE